MTTYPSRLRLGLTSLVQPINSSGNVVSATAATIAANRAIVNTSNQYQASAPFTNSQTTLGKRQRSRVDYTERTDIPEAESSEESSEEEEEDPEEEARMSRAARAAKRSGMPVPISTPRDSPVPEKKSKQGNRDLANRSWLGQEPPGDLVMVQVAKKHQLPYLTEAELERKAEDNALLVPIRIEVDTDALRIRDFFTWNMNESTITPEIFAKIFCLDVDLPYETYGTQIANAIKSQLDEHMGVAEVSLLTPEQEAAKYEGDLRVMLNLDVQIGTLHLIDRVEWDLTSPLTPETFARQLCTDLGLGGEAQMIISHAVHEELLRLKRDCLELGLVGKLIDSGGASGRERGAKKLDSVWRDWNEAKLYGPHLEILSAEAIDSLERMKARHPRRENRGQESWTQQLQRERAGRRR